jgi:hypothetical protein
MRPLLHDRADDRIGVRQVGEHRSGVAGLELLHGVAPRRDTDGARTDADAAGDVGRRVADHDDVVARHRGAEQCLGAASRDLGKLRPLVMIRAERADPKALGRDAHGGQLGVRTRVDVAGEQSEDDVVALLQRMQQLGHPGEDVIAVIALGELFAEQREVAVQHQFQARVDVRLGDAGVAHQLAYDLRIRLAVEAMLAGSGLTEMLGKRLEHGTAARAVGPQDGAVDVEQHDPLRAFRSGSIFV